MRTAIDAAKVSIETAKQAFAACEAAARQAPIESDTDSLVQELHTANADADERVQHTVMSVNRLLVRYRSETAELVRQGIAALGQLDATLESVKHAYDRLDLSSLPPETLVRVQDVRKQSSSGNARLLNASRPSAKEAISAVQSAGATIARCDDARSLVKPELGKDSAELLQYRQSVEAASAAVRRAEPALVEVGCFKRSTIYKSHELHVLPMFFLSINAGSSPSCSGRTLATTN